MKQNNLLLSFFTALVWATCPLHLNASMEPQEAHKQEYVQLPKWDYTAPIYVLYPAADSTTADAEHSARFLQVPPRPALPLKAHAVQNGAAHTKQAKTKDEAALVEQASKALQLQQQAQANEILNVGMQIIAANRAAIQWGNNGTVAAKK